jgi:hypothetical protein
MPPEALVLAITRNGGRGREVNATVRTRLSVAPADRQVTDRSYVIGDERVTWPTDDGLLVSLPCLRARAELGSGQRMQEINPDVERPFAE